MRTISVIVPVYNAYQYLEKCVNTILRQTFDDFELILVDDGSIDLSGDLCEQIKLKDERVRVYHKKNGGHASARNYGIDKAFESETKYITFIDSDDWVDEHYLEYLYKAIIEKNADISMCSYERVDNRNEKTDLEYKVVDYTPEKIWCDWRINATLPCAKLYKKELFETIRWPNKIHDDEHMTYKLLFACEYIPFVNVALYRYFYNVNSVMASGWSIKHLDSIDAIRERKEYFYENGFKNAYQMDCKLYIEELYNTLLELKKIEGDYKKLYNRLKRELKLALIKYGNHSGVKWNNYKYIYIYAFPCVKLVTYIEIFLKKFFKKKD